MMSRRKLRVQIALDGTRYSGELAQPIVMPNRLDLVEALQNFGLYGPPQNLVGNFISARRAAKLPDLFKTFGLEPGDTQGLAVRLALAHVPGFQLGKRRGAPKRAVSGWEIVALLEGWRAQNPGKPLAAAIRWAITTGPLKGMKSETVRRKYNLAGARK